MRENAFEHKKKKLGLNLTLGYKALIGLRTTGPWFSGKNSSSKIRGGPGG